MFEVGSKVVYPHHGVAVVEKIETRELNEEKVDFYVLRVQQRGWETNGDLVLRVPLEKADEVGVREAVSPEDAAEVLDVLAVTDVRVPSNWSRRYKNHQEKMRSGDVYAVAEVVRNLTLRERQSSMSAAEKTMYGNARHLLISELAVSWTCDEAEAERRVDEALGLVGDTE